MNTTSLARWFVASRGPHGGSEADQLSFAEDFQETIVLWGFGSFEQLIHARNNAGVPSC